MGFIPKSKQGSLPSCKLSSALGTRCLPGWRCVCWQHLGCGTAVTAVPIPAAWPSGWLPYPWQGGETRRSSRSFLTQNHRMAYDSLGRRRETGNSGGGAPPPPPPHSQAHSSQPAVFPQTQPGAAPGFAMLGAKPRKRRAPSPSVPTAPPSPRGVSLCPFPL